MSETQNPVVVVEPAAAPAPARRRHGLLWLAAVVLLGAIAYLGWRVWALDAEQQRLAQTGLQQVDAQIAALNRATEQARRDAEALRARLDDENKVNQSLREQLLGLSERARLVEDAIANLAEKRLTGHDALLLDEAELLLALGAERYTLFHDPAATLAAYGQADATLAALEDPAFSTVRQSISAEVDALTRLTGVDVAATLAALGALRSGAAKLPAAHGPRAPADTAAESHWWQVFGNFVRVRTGEDAAALAQRHEATLARQLLVLDLRDAQAALLARDDSRYHAALADAQATLKIDFDAGADGVKAADATLARLAQAQLAPPPPALLGAALKELRNLRATHALRQPVRAAAKAPEGQP